MENDDELRRFLVAARARLRPEDVGVMPLPGSRARRVPGLRREEVAGLAGVSVDYYARLEQGRATRVSQHILAAVARVLQLNATEQEYLRSLVAGHFPDAAVAPEQLPQRVRPGIHQILTALVDSPAFVVGRGMQLLAMNKIARLLMFDMDSVPQVERNLARWTFLSDQARDRYRDWEAVASDTAAILRVDAAAARDSRSLHELIGELSVKSADFRRLWSEHKVYECTHGSKRFTHPDVGDVDIEYEAFDVPGSAEQKMFVYTAADGSSSADALRILASWNADTPDPRHTRAVEPMTRAVPRE